jgi:hypothetical protein
MFVFILTGNVFPWNQVYCKKIYYINTVWHVDPLLGNDREISNYTTSATAK